MSPVTTATRAPVSTYRLQFGEHMRFADARALVPYLHGLGITDLYASPLLRAHPESTHGYDVADPTMFDPRLGTRDEFDALSDALREHDMGLVLDIVPNHMTATPDNPWWRDVLVHGPGSRYADYFDIDWQGGDGRLMLPLLGAPLEEVLERGELTVDGDELVYYDTRLPIAPGTGGGTAQEVHARQHYRLAFWRLQATELNYRRFFDISTLAAVRVELPHVFDAVHAFVLELVREGRVTGLRIDHVDGLADPKGYLEQLQRATREATGRDEPFYVLVEKILAHDERLPEDWPVAGATGYEFLDSADGVLVDPPGARELMARYAKSVGDQRPFEQVVLEQKRRTMHALFRGELDSLTRRAAAVVNRGPDAAAGAAGAISDDDLREAIVEVTAALPVYRTYIDHAGAREEDQRRIDEAVREAGSSPAMEAFGHALLASSDLAMRWQQFTGPVTAKSVEDTAFYRYYALPSRDEVGTEPSVPSVRLGEFHHRMRERAQRWPLAMNATSTHDTKRGEDVRARIAVLSQMPQEWAHFVESVFAQHEPPDRVDGWMVLTTLLGAAPIDAARLEQYVLKAVREAKRHTSWVNQDEEYERAIVGYAERLRSSGIIDGFVERVEPGAHSNSMSLLLLRLACPGVPDTYQGTELERLALVDPDNRRPVDFERRRRLLEACDGTAGTSPADASGGDAEVPERFQLLVAALRARRGQPELFARGEYVLLEVEGAGASHVIAFARRHGDQWALAIGPRLVAGEPALADVKVVLPMDAPTSWQHAVTGETVVADDRRLHVASVFEAFPVALLLPS